MPFERAGSVASKKGHQHIISGFYTTEVFIKVYTVCVSKLYTLCCLVEKGKFLF